MEIKEIISYLKSDNPNLLYKEADRVRKKYCGDKVHLRGIIEFSNYCGKECKYCGLRRSNKRVVRYRMSGSEILLAVRKALRFGCKTIVLQSGEDKDCQVEELCGLIERIKKDFDCAVTLSIGEKTYEEYKQLREAGADRYLLKFETSSKTLFRKLRPGSSYDKRLQCVYQLKELGYQIGSGNMVGLPGQTQELLAEDILLMKKLDLDMISVGPFIPHLDTPLYNAERGRLEDALKVLALVRIFTKKAHIPATTAMGVVDLEGRRTALQCGANVIMPKFTPGKYGKHYKIYPDEIYIDEKPPDFHMCIESMIGSLGREIAEDYGDSLLKREGVWNTES